jgi:leucyl aminopeptidase
VDLATLTGACVVALGRRATGLFSASDDLRERLVQAGTEAHERLWPMPHWEDYQEELRSRVADLKNVGGKYGGAVTAFAFLRNFAGDRSWAHLDIAGTAWDMPQTEYYEGGATGTAVRTLLRFLAKLG